MSSALPIIIGGFYRSGTTLVRRLLDSHSRIHCGPEVKFFKDFYGEYIGDDLAHVRLFATARSYALPEDELLDLFGQAFVAFHARAAQRAGKSRWADKNPENVIHLDAWETLLPDGFVFLHVVRDPRDTLASLIEAGFPRTIPTEFEAKVTLYEQYRKAGAHYCHQHPSRCHTIAYEQLVTNPESTLQKLFDFLHEPYEPQIMERFFATERGRGIEDPKVAKTRSIHANSIGRWRGELDKTQLALIEQRLSSYFV